MKEKKKSKWLWDWNCVGKPGLEEKVTQHWPFQPSLPPYRPLPLLPVFPSSLSSRSSILSSRMELVLTVPCSSLHTVFPLRAGRFHHSASSLPNARAHMETPLDTAQCRCVSEARGRLRWAAIFSTESNRGRGRGRWEKDFPEKWILLTKWLQWTLLKHKLSNLTYTLKQYSVCL